MGRLYFDVDGNEHARNEWDIHHPFNRASLKGTGEKRWGDLFAIPMYKIHHNLGKNALHFNAPHLPKPGKDLAYLLRLRRYEQMDNPETTIYDDLVDTNTYIHDLADESENTKIRQQAGRIAKAFELQMPYILLGQVITIDEVPMPMQVNVFGAVSEIL